MSREAVAQRCSCQSQILVGLSDDWCARVVRVSPVPLNPLGEMLARLAGLQTFELHREGEHCCLYERDRWHIAGRAAGELVYCWRVDVLTEHRCGWVFPTAPSLLAVRQVNTVDPTAPPPF